MTGDGIKVPHEGSPEGRHRTWLQGVAHERARVIERLRARATSEEVTADRWAQSGDDRMTALHRKSAEVLLDECDRIESGA